MRRSFVMLIGLALAATACQAEQGSVSFENRSGDHLLWVRAVPERLEVFLGSNTGWATIAPNGTSVRDSSFGANPPDWCDEPTVVNYLLRPVNGRSISASTPTNLSVEDLEIVAERGPGHCWTEKNGTWVFNG